MNWLTKLYVQWERLGLVLQIVIGMLVGIILACFVPTEIGLVGLFGDLFVGALKAVAPVLVFTLVLASLVQHRQEQKTNIKKIVVLYLVGTLSAAVCAVLASFAFPCIVRLEPSATDLKGAVGLSQVLKTLLESVVQNPVKAVANGNYIGILAWAISLGLFMRQASDTTKQTLSDLSDGVSALIRVVIKFAPLGVCGLVYNSVVSSGLGIFAEYGQLLALLVGTMVVVALVINPLIVAVVTRHNPYPLVFECLRSSGVTAFFTRSSAANIPINLQLCEKLGLDKATYSISIPLGSTVNMEGAAVTITVLTLAAANTLGIRVDFGTATVLSFMAALGACGASGVAGGSLLLVPMACAMFGIGQDTAMQVVAVGFILSVLQDSCETALNSSSDVVLTAAADIAAKRESASA